MVVRRDQVAPEQRAAAAATVARRGMAELVGLAPGSVVGLYAAKGAELDLFPLHELVHRAGLRAAYPRVVAGQPRLEFALAEPAALVPAAFGLREPAQRSVRVELAELAVVFVPGLAFDGHGGRLGWGKGYYDATLPHAAKARRIGVGFECQIIEHVPRAAHDVLMQAILTEAKVRQVGA